MKFYQKWWHYYIGFMTGRKKACGKKVNYKSFASSQKAAIRLSKKWDTHQEAITGIYNALYKNKIGIPFPTSTIHIKK